MNPCSQRLCHPCLFRIPVPATSLGRHYGQHQCRVTLLLAVITFDLPPSVCFALARVTSIARPSSFPLSSPEYFEIQKDFSTGPRWTLAESIDSEHTIFSSIDTRHHPRSHTHRPPGKGLIPGTGIQGRCKVEREMRLRVACIGCYYSFLFLPIRVFHHPDCLRSLSFSF